MAGGKKLLLLAGDVILTVGLTGFDPVMLITEDVVVKPPLSVAIAVIVSLPAVTLAQLKL